MKEPALARKSNIGRQTVHASCFGGTGRAHASILTPVHVVLRCRDQGRSPKRSTMPRSEQSCNVHFGCCGRDPEASELQPHVTRQSHNRHMRTRGLRLIEARGYGSQRKSSHPTISRWQQMRGKWLMRMGNTIRCRRAARCSTTGCLHTALPQILSLSLLRA